jgi:hypothetical protein
MQPRQSCSLLLELRGFISPVPSKNLDARGWETDDLTLTALLRNPAYRAAWKMARTGMSVDYHDYIDVKLKSISSSGA